MYNAVLSYMGLARRAGKLSLGMQAVKKSVMSGRAFLVVIASDISEKSEKEVRYFCAQRVKAVKIENTIFEVTQAIGCKAGIVSFDDRGFSKAVLEHISR